MRALPHKHWFCAVLLSSLPLVARLIMLCTIQWCFVEVALPLKNRLVKYCSFGSVSYTLVFLVYTILVTDLGEGADEGGGECPLILYRKEEITEGRKAGRANKTKPRPPPPPPLDRSRSGFTTASVIFSIWFAFSSHTYVVVTSAIILELCYYAGAVASFPLFPWWPGRMSHALARLLTLRLPSLGWVSSEPFCFSLTVCLYS